MQQRIERFGAGVEPANTEAIELRQELLAYEVYPLQQRIARGGARPTRGVERAIEVVYDFEEADEDLAPAPLRVLRDFLAHARARTRDVLRVAAVLAQILLELLERLSHLPRQLIA